MEGKIYDNTSSGAYKPGERLPSVDPFFEALEKARAEGASPQVIKNLEGQAFEALMAELIMRSNRK